MRQVTSICDVCNFLAVQDFLEPLQLTPEHLVYYLPESETFDRSDQRPELLMASSAQKPASELEVNDLLLLFDSTSPSPARSCPQNNTETVSSWVKNAASWSSPDGNACQLDSQAGRPAAGLRVVRVTELTRVTHRGAKTLYTMSGNVLVAGVLCSNFGDYYPALPGQQWRDRIPFKLFAPHRAVFRLLPYPRTTELLRALMDRLVLPALRWLRPLLSEQS
jgi:hypothetical protein